MPDAKASVRSGSSTARPDCRCGLTPMPTDAPASHVGVSYNSRGAVLVIGDGPAAVKPARQLAARLKVILFAPGVDALTDLPENVVRVGGRIASVQGHLGDFSASVAVAHNQVRDAGIFSPNVDRKFDLVLDLGRAPHMRQGTAPCGYFAPGDDAELLARALDTLPGIVGRFWKPQYVQYRSEICTHGAMGIPGCKRCLDACACGAIRSTGERIEVDAYLCQGCAACTMACPTGALALDASMAGEDRWRDALEPVSDASTPWLAVVHDAASRDRLTGLAAPQVRLIEVCAIPEFSETLWMETLARGASALILVVDPAAPSQTLNTIARTVAEAKEILLAIGRAAEAITVAAPGEAAMTIDALLRLGVSSPPAIPVRSESKRTRFLAAVDAIASTDKPPATRDLAEGASFGAVIVDRQGCTLCLACTNLCPTGALTRGNGTPPALMFKESLCVQCNLCRGGCPEKAITLQPRFLPKRSEREEIRILHADEPVPCSRCGAPFTTRRMLAVSMALVDSQRSLTMPGGTAALRQCPACRQREILAET